MIKVIYNTSCSRVRPFGHFWVVLFITALTAFAPNFSVAQQLSSYTFSTGNTGTLEDISTGSTSLLTGRVDDGAATVMGVIGFGFPLGGTTYTHFSANPNGQMELHTSSGATLIGSNVTPAANRAYLAPMAGDNEVGNGIRYKLLGTAPNRKLVVEWNQFQAYFSPDVTNNGDMQVWLEEATGKVTYIYGTIYNAQAATTSRSIYFSTSNTATTLGYVTVANPSTFAFTTTSVSNSFAAGNGTTTGTTPIANLGSTGVNSRIFFTWSPPAPCTAPTAQPTALNLTAASAIAVNGSFTAASGSPSGYLVVGYIAGSTPTAPVNGTAYSVGQSLGSGVVVSSGSSITFNATGLIGNTSYDVYVYSMNTGLTCSPSYLTASPLTGTVTTPPCPTVTLQPSALNLTTPSATIVGYSFTGSTPAATGYLVVRYPAGSAITHPTNTINYTVGQALGLGTVVQSGTAVSGSISNLLAAQDIYVYAYESTVCGSTYNITNFITASVTPIPPVVPSCPGTISPLNNAVSVYTNSQLTWSGMGGDPSPTVDVYFSTDQSLVASMNASVRVLTNSTATSYTPTLALTTTYYWMVVPKNVGGSPTCTVNQFTTQGQLAPLCPTSFTPASGATNIFINQVLSWSGAFGNPAIYGYNVYLGTDFNLVNSLHPSTQVAFNLNATSFTPSATFLPSTTYYWTVVPVNSIGPAAGCSPSSFTTRTPDGITSTAQGGLWSSAATWAGGVVPSPTDNVTIADGATVTIDGTYFVSNLTIGSGSGATAVLQYGGSSFTFTALGNILINSNGRFHPHTSASTPVGQLIQLGGNLTNNGYANFATASTALLVAGSQITGGSMSQTLNGTGTFEGNGTYGIFRTLTFATSGSVTINTSQNLCAYSSTLTTGTLNTNGKLRIDNGPQPYNVSLNRSVSNVVVTSMGSSISVAPVVFGNTTVNPIVVNITNGVVNTRYFNGNDVYICTGAGVFTSLPTGQFNSPQNFGASVIWVGTLGTIGNPWITGTLTVGTQYFYGGNLYTAVATAGSSTPPTHTSGTNGTSFRYAGTPAQITVNYSSATQTVRSVNIVNYGSGYYTSAPTMTFSPGAVGATGTLPSATPVFFQQIIGPAQSSFTRGPSSTIVGALDIQSTTGIVGASVSVGGVNYASAPTIAFSLPHGYTNLVTNPGSGYTSAPTVTVAASPTFVSGGSVPTFTVTVNGGKVVGVYCTGGGNGWTTLPTLTLTGGGGTGATIAFPANCLALGTAVMNEGTLTGINITNPGSGYLNNGGTAPTVTIATNGAAPATVASGGTARVGLYNLTYANLVPSTSNPVLTTGVEIPASNKVHQLFVGTTTSASSSARIKLSNNLEIYSPAYTTMFPTGTPTSYGSYIDMNGYNILFSHQNHAGLGTTGGYVNAAIGYMFNGSVTMTFPGGGGTGGITKTFPFYHPMSVSTGTGTVATGAVMNTMTVSDLGAPSGVASPFGFATGKMSFKISVPTGAVYGTAPIVTLTHSPDDLFPTNFAQGNVYVGQSTTGITGGWTIRSVSTGGNAVLTLPAGSRATGTTGSTIFTHTLDVDDYVALIHGATNTDIVSFAPSNLCSGGGTSVTINGTGFFDVTSVKFNGVPATSFTVNTGTSTITGATTGSGTVTYTSAGHPFSVGQLVTISGATPTGFNIVDTVSAVTASTFSFANTFTGTYTSGGTASGITTITAVTPPGLTAGYITIVAQGVSDTSLTQYTVTNTSLITSSSDPSTNLVCTAGGSVHITLTETGTPTADAINWTGPSMNTTTGPDVTVSPSTSSVYTMTATYLNGCTVTKTYNVGVIPGTSLSPTATPASSCFVAGNTVSLNSNLSAGNFAVVSIPYSAATAPSNVSNIFINNATVAPYVIRNNADDGGWADIPLGFNYNFFGSSFDKVAVGSNGTLMFGTVPGFPASTGYLGQYTFITTNGQMFPNPLNPGNIIALFSADMGGSGGSITVANHAIRHWTEGVAPTRRFIIEYRNWPNYNNGSTNTVQCMLYETTGIVEVHILNYATGTKTIGLQNGAKTIGAVAPGRLNFTNGITTPEAWRFLPPTNYSYNWSSTVNNQLNDSTLSAPTFTPTAAGTYNFTLSVTNPNTGCVNKANLEVKVNPTPPAPSITGTLGVCGSGSTALFSSAPGTGNSIRWYNLPLAGTQVNAGTLFITPTITTTTTYYVAEQSALCSSTRTPVTVTINTPPPFAVNDPVVCNGTTITQLTATASGYDTYIWSPLTGLYQDAAKLYPYTGQSLTTVYADITAGVSKYFCNANSFTTLCSAKDSAQITIQPVTATVTANTTQICITGSADLNLITATAPADNSVQWQISTDNVSFTDIPGADTTVYSTGPLSVTTYYRAIVKDQTGAPCATTASIQINYTNPQVTGSTGATRCGTGTVTLQASAPAGVINWYAASTGGSSLGTGTSFVTPVISATTTFYAALTLNGCEGARTAVVATVTTAPDLTLTANKTVCNNSITQLSVTSSTGDYSSYVWSPATNLYTDAAATVPYVAGSSATTVYAQSSVSGSTTYYVSASNVAADACADADSVKLTVLPASASISSTPTALCASGSAVLKLSPKVTYTGGTIQWQISADNVTYNDIPGANDTTYSTGTITSSTWYQVVVKNSDGVTCFTTAPFELRILAVSPVAATAAQAVCNDAVATITITSTVSDYDTYVWSPVGNLFTDAAATIPYVAGSSAVTVYAKTATSGSTTYTVTASNSSYPGACTSSGTTSVTVQPATATISSNPTAICGTGTAVLSLSPSSTYGTGTIQWQVSADNITYNDIPGANSSTYTTPTTNTATWYQAVVKNSAGATCFTTTPYELTVSNPSITGTTNGSRCGTGAVTLSATASAGATVTWYTQLSGGSSVATGTSYSPVVSTVGVNNFYVSAEIGSCKSTPRQLVTATVSAADPITVTANQTVCNNVITQLDVTLIGSYDTYVWSPATNLFTDAAATVPYVAGSSANTVYAQTATAGTTTYYVQASNSSDPLACMRLDSTKLSVLPATVTLTTTPSGACLIGSATLALSPTGVYPAGSVQWQSSSDNVSFANITDSTRTSYVTGTITTATWFRVIVKNSAGATCVTTSSVAVYPAITVTASQTICNNVITPLSVTSTLANYASYVWSPVSSLFTDAAATIPYVAGDNVSTVYLKRSIAGSNTYTVTATETASGCTTTATTVVAVQPASATITANPASVCITGSSTLSLSPATGYAANSIQWEQSADNVSFVAIPSATGTSYTASGITDTMYYRVVVKTGAAGSTCFTTAVYQLNFVKPEILTTVPGTRCNSGTVALSATAAGATAINWYAAASGGTPLFIGANFTTPVIFANTDYYVSASNGTCESARVAVTATVTTPPDLTITGPQVVCSGVIAEYTVTSDVNNYQTYVWSPAANLFTNAAATIPYVAGSSATTVYVKSNAAGEITYTVTANNSTSACAQTTTTKHTVQLSTATVTASPSTICISGTSVLSLSPSNPYASGSLQWQRSADNINWFDIPAAIGTTYTTLTQAVDRYYRVQVKDGLGNACFTTSPTTVAVSNPQLTSVTNGVRCGIGNVTLSATSSAGSVLSWYNTPVGGSDIGFIYTPVTVTGFNADIVANGIGLPATSTTAQADDVGNYLLDGTFQINGAAALPTYYLPANNVLVNASNTSQQFNLASYSANNALRLASGSATGTLTLTTPQSGQTISVLAMAGSGAATMNGTITFTDATTQTVTGLSVKDWYDGTPFVAQGIGRCSSTGPDAGAGSGNPRLYEITMDITAGNLSKQIASITFTRTTTATTGSIINIMALNLKSKTSSYVTPILSSTTTYYVTASIGSCTTGRTPVTATITPAPVLTVGGQNVACNGEIVPLSVTSTLADFDSYTWSPSTNLYTDAAATVPYIAGTNQSTVYFKSTSIGQFIYTVTGNNSVSGCVNLAAIAVTTNPASFSLTPLPATICVSGSSTISASANGGFSYATLIWQTSNDSVTFTTVPGAFGPTYTTPVITSKTYVRAILTNSDGDTCYMANTAVNVNNPQVIATAPATRCGIGTVNLGATPSAGTNLNWFANATGGTSMGSGNSFTTPVLTVTDTFYVESDGGSSAVTGLGLAASGIPETTGASAERGIVFDAYENFTLVSAQYYSPTLNVTNNVVVRLVDNTGTQLQTVTLPVVQGGTAGWYTMNINFPVTAGTGYRLLASFSQSVNRVATGVSYSSPAFNNLGSVGLITSGYDGGASATTYSYFHNIAVISTCKSARVPVVATVTSAPNLQVSADDKICNNAIGVIEIATPLTDFHKYTWAPVTNLFTDAAATVPYVAGASASKVYVRSSVASLTQYIVTGTDTVSNCVNEDTVYVTILPTSISVVSDPPDVCVSGSVKLSVANQTGYAFGGGVWQSSPDGITWTTIPGSQGTTYITPVITTSTYYRTFELNTVGDTCLVGVKQVVVNNPSILSTAPATRCGIGTVTLGATASAGANINWYATATGGTSLYTGNSFTTPQISNTTTYYAAASAGGTTAAMPSPNVGTSTFITTTAGWGLYFTVNAQTTISTVDVYPQNSTPGPATIAIRITDQNDVLLYTGPVHNFTSTASPSQVTVPVGIALPPGQYKMGMTYTGLDNMVRESGGLSFPYTSAGNEVSITSGSTGTGNSQTTGAYYWFYHWVITTGCEGVRQPVVATVTTAPAITASSAVTICSGQSTTLTVTSPNDPNNSYVWTPGNLNGGSVSVSPTASTVYSVLATDTTAGANAGCTNVATVNVTVNPIPTGLAVTPPSASLCDGVTAVLTASVTNTGTATFGTQASQNTTTTYPAPYSLYYGGQRMQTLITAAELTAAGYTAGAQFSSIAFPVVSMGANWSGSISLNSFQIKMGATSLTSLTAFQPGLTTVVAPSNYVPVVGYTNSHTFNSPFTWDGTSNVIIETTFGNGITGTTDDAIIQYNSPTSYQSTIVYRADGITAAQAEAGTTISFSFSARPDFKLTAANPSTFTWSPAAGLNTTTGASVTVSATTNTTYTVTATNTFGCTSAVSVPVTVSVNPKPIVTPTSDTTVCFGNIIKLAVADTGAFAGGYPAGTTVDWIGIVSGLTPQDSITSDNGTTYQALVTVPGGCQGTTSVRTIITRSVTTTPTITDPACGQSNGRIKNTVSGGSAPYRFVWSQGSTIIRDTTTNNPVDSIYGLAAGSYTLEVTDSVPFGCSSGLINYTLTSASPIVASITTSNPISCNGVSDGVLTATYAGGTGTPAQYSYLWNTGAVTPTIGSLPAGAYTVTITDLNGCTDDVSYTLTQPDLISAVFTQTLPGCPGASNGALDAVISGGTLPYQITEWYDSNFNGPFATGTHYGGIAAGDHVLYVMDANSCEGILFATLDDAAPAAIDSFAPVSGPVGTLVTIYGKTLAGSTAVSFNGVAATSFTVVSNTQITATVPATATTGTISVVTACGTVTSTGSFTVTAPSFATFNLKAFMQGYYIGSSTMNSVLSNQFVSSDLNECDTVTVELRDPLSPSTTVYTAKGLLNISGQASINFPSSANGQSFYIVVNHRSSVQTWSALPVTFSATTSYDFSTAAAQAFGDNQKQVEPGVWAFWAGDINQDGFLGVDDVTIADNDNLAGVVGVYIASDVNGDGFLGVDDVTIIDDNNLLGIFVITP